MKSIRSRITLIIIIAVVLSTGSAMALGIRDVISLGQDSSEQALKLLCENGEKNLDYYFDSVGQSVEMVASYAEADIESGSTDDLKEHVKRVDIFFGKIARQTSGVLTYYYRLDPSVSKDVTGFWYVEADGNGFTEHEVTDITKYDLNDTTQLVWYTVPRASREPVWLPPYITDNLDVRVISYNVPVIIRGQFMGVIGIEIDYSTMAEQVNNIRLYKSGYAFLNDREGNIIYHPSIDVLGLSKEEIPRTPKELREYEKYIEYNFDGVDKMAYRLPLKNGMILNVTVPVSEISGTWKNLIKRTVWVSLGLLVIFILLAWQFASHITKPVSDLAKAAKEVSNGNYDVELSYNGKDEVGTLTHSFKSLTEHLKAYISELNDVNQHLKDDNLTLEAATTRDSLTGVKNRFALRRDYDTYHDQDIHIMMLDIDDFKKVNDQYGHSVGDYLLKKTGDALLDNFGADHSYRYGGDEFMVIYPDITEEEFRLNLVNLEVQLENIYLEDKKLPVHFSAGYVYGKNVLQDDLRLMLREADELLYHAKKTGKNTFTGEAYNREKAEHIEKKEEESFRQG
jgi:diguanylate cyclase (GGDEF)-like protein